MLLNIALNESCAKEDRACTSDAKGLILRDPDDPL